MDLKYFFIQNLAFSPFRYKWQEHILSRQFMLKSVSEMFDCLIRLDPELASNLEKLYLKSKLDMQGCEGVFFQRVIWGDELYPQSFYLMKDPPWALSCIGSVEALTGPRILSVVGSREPWSGALEWMDLNLNQFVTQGWTLASGGARGVDWKVHQICLRRQKPTLIFLPSGLLKMYPQSWLKLQDDVKSCGGVLVTEFPDKFEMKKYSFGFRNRLIAQIGRAVLIIEAKQKSGTLMTGYQALEAGREVFVVPSHPQLLTSFGGYDLLRQGAQWVANADDLGFYLN